MPALNETYGTNDITVTNDGDYEINYGVSGTVGADTTLTLGVYVGGVAQPSATVSKDFVTTVENSLSGSTILNLPAGSVVTLQISGSTGTTLTPSDNVNTYLTVKKLNSGTVA